MGIRLTPRDLSLLQWINAAGFVTIDHIVRWLKVARPTAYIRTKKLAQHGYLIHERIFHGMPGIYRVSALGVQVCGSNLSVFRRVPLATYRHDLFVAHLSLILTKHYQGSFITERELRNSEEHKTFGQRSHLPDGVIVIDGKRMAIEVELNKKSRRRREKIFGHYLKNFDFDEVWYFCSNQEIIRQIKPFMEKASFFKVFLISEFLEELQEASIEPFNRVG